MGRLPEIDRETYEELLTKAGMPVWASYQEIIQARDELPDGTQGQIYARAYQILYDKFGKPAEGA